MTEIAEMDDAELVRCYYLVLSAWLAHPEYKLLHPIIIAYADELEKRDVRY